MEKDGKGNAGSIAGKSSPTSLRPWITGKTCREGDAWRKSPPRPTIGRQELVLIPFFRTTQPEHDSMAAIGRLGQFLGLTIPAVAILLELNHAISLGQMLVMLVAALCCFWIGRIIEGYTRR
jgi:hypothetical protein